tara:strand:+ start:5292 stop:8534 length:3243 start_codon:yes stop_codon:yes gene_type:complete
MSDKYRVKLENKRIVGPFTSGQIAELFERGHVSEESDCQVFPAGDWNPLNTFEAINKSIYDRLSGKSNQTQTSSEATIVKMMIPKKKVNKQLQEKLSETNTSSTDEISEDDEKLSEFKYEKDKGPEVDYDELEKRYQQKQAKKIESDKELEELKQPEEPKVDAVPSLERTRVIKRPVLNEGANQEATKVLDANKIKKELEDNKRALEQKIEEQAKKVADASNEEDELDTNEATEFINIGSMLPAISKDADKAEKEIVHLAKQKDSEALIASGVDLAEDLDDEIEEEEEEETKRGMKPVVLIAFIVVFWFLFFDEEAPKEKPIQPQRVSVLFPSQGEFLEEDKAAQALAQGVELMAKQDYLSLVAAAKSFRVSLFYKFQDNPAMGYLILTYARIYPNAKSRLEASTTLFNLVRVSQDKLLTDANVAIGTAEFYLNAKKYLTAVNTIENYLRVSKKPTVTMLAVYLEALVKSGKLVEAKEVFEKIKDLSPLPIEAYINMSEYLELDEKFSQAAEVIDRGLKSYPNSVELLLKRAQLHLSAAEIKPYQSVLTRVEDLKAEQCPVYFADFLQHMGNASVLSGNSAKAAEFYKRSLTIQESPELRTRLASLAVGGDQASQALIKESKIHELIKKSRFAMREFDWESAFVYAIEASDLNPLYIESNLLLVEIQIKRGYYSAALNTLLRLKKSFPTNKQINTRLIETYIASFRFNDAITAINEYAQVEGAVNTPEYASMLGKYYYVSGNDPTAVKWLTEAVSRDPLADEDLFLMAKIYIKNGKYSDGKLMLSKALMLDPVNLRYQALYAQTLYDKDGADTAIGYLRDLLSSNKDSPQILGEIAKYYYKSGQIKEFNLYREKVEQQEIKDESFYHFMIYASELNQQTDKVLSYARELIKINPGDLATHIKIGEYLTKQGRLSQSIEAYELVKERMETYPKINYLIAKSYLEMDNLEKALEHAELEIKNNPKIPQGYYIAGEVLARRSEYPQAIKNLEKAVTIDYGYVEALVALAKLKRRQNSHEQARELLLRALKAEPNNPLIHRELGHVYRAVGQGVLAAESFKTYLTLMPSARDRSEIEALIRVSQ